MSWERLENYRVKTGKTWQQVAEDIGLGRSMMMMVKTGKRQLSPKAIYRLELAEIQAGIRKPHLVEEASAGYGAGGAMRELVEELRELKRDLATMDKRVDQMIRRIGHDR